MDNITSGIPSSHVSCRSTQKFPWKMTWEGPSTGCVNHNPISSILTKHFYFLVQYIFKACLIQFIEFIEILEPYKLYMWLKIKHKSWECKNDDKINFSLMRIQSRYDKKNKYPNVVLVIKILVKSSSLLHYYPLF